MGTHFRAHDLGPPLVMVVEDDRTVASMTCRMLMAEGYQCESARMAMEALTMVEDRALTVDLFIIDVTLPDMPGPQLASQLAKLCPSAAIIFISGYLDHILAPPVEVRRSIFLAKPFTWHQLLHAVHQLIPLAPP